MKRNRRLSKLLTLEKHELRVVGTELATDSLGRVVGASLTYPSHEYLRGSPPPEV